MSDTLEVLKPMAERRPSPARLALMNAIAQCTGGILMAWADAQLVLARASEALGRRLMMPSLQWMRHAGLVEICTARPAGGHKGDWAHGRDMVRLTQEGAVEQFAYGPEVVR